MSYLVVRCLCPHYEDYDPIGMERNAVQGWPALWEPERYAEGGLYEEFRAMREQAALVRRYAKAYPPANKDGSTLVRALVSLAKENEWKVKSEDAERFIGHPVYAIPPLPDDDPAPYNWNDYIRWLDRQKTRDEEAEAEAKREAEEREAQRRRDNRIMIDYSALVNMMGDMMPEMEVVTMRKKPRAYRVPKADAIIQALVMLADEGKWKRNNPSGFRGPEPPQVYRIR